MGTYTLAIRKRPFKATPCHQRYQQDYLRHPKSCTTIWEPVYHCQMLLSEESSIHDYIQTRMYIYILRTLASNKSYCSSCTTICVYPADHRSPSIILPAHQRQPHFSIEISIHDSMHILLNFLSIAFKSHSCMFSFASR